MQKKKKKKKMLLFSTNYIYSEEFLEKNTDIRCDDANINF